MAKPATVLIKLVSTAGTGFFYTTKKNPRKTTEKLALRKYDPKVGKHDEIKEAKIKQGAAPYAIGEARAPRGLFVCAAPGPRALTGTQPVRTDSGTRTGNGRAVP